MASSGDRLEELVLSGELFNPSARSSSPARSASPASQPEEAEWPPADADYDESAYSSTIGSRPRPSTAGVENGGGGGEEIGMGPGRTGVKGVIRDRAEAVARERERRARDADALARRMERASLVGSGPGPGEGRKGRFGHLREVGMHGFLHAVEDEPGAIWVVVHIYEPSLQRCDTVDDVLVRLARQHTDTKFLRCRASALGYASLPRSRSSAPARRIGKLVEVDDEDDPYGEPEADAGGEDDDEDDAEVDTDMLPTMHVYRAGELVYNWVRVDWEAGDAGLEELLARHGVIDQSLRVAGEDDGEDVLTFSGVP